MFRPVGGAQHRTDEFLAAKVVERQVAVLVVVAMEEAPLLASEVIDPPSKPASYNPPS